MSFITDSIATWTTRRFAGGAWGRTFTDIAPPKIGARMAFGGK
jgi:hypothetical protein